MPLSACKLTVEHCDFVAKAAENIWFYDTTVKSDVDRCIFNYSINLDT